MTRVKNEIDDVNDEIAKIDAEISKGITLWKALLSKRLEIKKHYATIRKRLLDSKAYPHKHIKKPSSSDKEGMEQYNKDVALLKRYIDKIIATLDKGNYANMTPIAEAEKAIDWLERAQKLS